MNTNFLSNLSNFCILNFLSLRPESGETQLSLLMCLRKKTNTEQSKSIELCPWMGSLQMQGRSTRWTGRLPSLGRACPGRKGLSGAGLHAVCVLVQAGRALPYAPLHSQAKTVTEAFLLRAGTGHRSDWGFCHIFHDSSNSEERIGISPYPSFGKL